MTEHRIPGSGNSLVGPNDDGIETLTELDQCRHCGSPVETESPMDDVCVEHIARETLGWNCMSEGCEHSWEQLGIPIHCPACHGTYIDSAVNDQFDHLRAKAVEKYFREIHDPLSAAAAKTFIWMKGNSSPEGSIVNQGRAR